MWKLIHRSAGVAIVLALVCTPVFGQTAKSPSEADLIKILKTSTSLREKEDACRQLATVGTKAAVPTLAGLLSNDKLAHMARYALEPMPDPAVDEALRTALGKLKGKLLAGAIASVGVRRDAQATDALVKHLGDDDPVVAQAAARALGRIATPEAVRALMNALASTSVTANEPALYEGLFRCAETLTAHGAREEAQAIYDVLRAGKAPPQISAAALRGAILTRKGKDRLHLLREQLRSEDKALFAAVVRAAQEIAEPEVASLLGTEVKELPSERRPLVLQAIVGVADKCLQGKNAAGAAGRLIGPLSQAMELAQSAELKEQTKTLIQAARSAGSKMASGSVGPMLEAGKTYWFTPAGNGNPIHAEVLQLPLGSWAKVQIKDNPTSGDAVWINLNQVLLVGENPVRMRAGRGGRGGNPSAPAPFIPKKD